MHPCIELNERAENCKSLQRKPFMKESHEPVVIKRKRKKDDIYIMPNSVQIIGDGVHQHPVFHNPFSFPNEHAVRLDTIPSDRMPHPLINCGDVSTTNQEIVSMQSSDCQPASPCLPPRLREQERMQHVQRWVNSIPQEPCPDQHSLPETSTSSGSSTGASRFFDELETRQVVEMFRDFFLSGSCPSVGEVRKRIADTALQDSRNPISVRSKVKRLQTNGRWADFT